MNKLGDNPKHKQGDLATRCNGVRLMLNQRLLSKVNLHGDILFSPGRSTNRSFHRHNPDAFKEAIARRVKTVFHRVCLIQQFGESVICTE